MKNIFLCCLVLLATRGHGATVDPSPSVDYSSSVDFSSSVSFVPPQPSPTNSRPPQPKTTEGSSTAPNIALYAGVAAVGVVILIILVVLIVVCTVARKRRAKGSGRRSAGNGEVNAITNANYQRDNERVTTTTTTNGKTQQYAGPPTQPRYVDDIHRYATIEGGYYYAPNIGDGPPPQLPQPRDGTQGSSPAEAEYEELPGDTAGTPNQSLTKTDRQAYQELGGQLNADQNRPYATLQPEPNEYLEPI